eukprot:gene36084-44500_t
MTRTYGRGTDFVCSDQDVLDSGATASEEIQIKGRTCRQDNPGSFKMILHGADLTAASIVTTEELTSGAPVTMELLAEKRRALDEARYKVT